MMAKSDSADAERARLQRLLDWFVESIGADEWNARKQAIEDHLEQSHTPVAMTTAETELASLSVSADRIGWYLYLLDMTINDPWRSEPTQGARILPTFQRLADDFNLLVSIEGVEAKRDRLLSVERRNPDSGLFELLVALLWKRNRWKRVAFIPEAPPAKRPDLEAQSKTQIWTIECKRLSKSSSYSEAERTKWLRMWRPLRELLVNRGYPVVLEIAFHVELQTLPDDFLVDQLAGKLALAVPPRSLVSNETFDVRVGRVDFARIRRHLTRNYVKHPSPQLNELIAGRIDPNRGFTAVVEARMVRVGTGRGNNRFVDEIGFAAGCYWHCDAERSIERKARDIRTRLSEAVNQIPPGRLGVVHIGLETLDGIMVEAARYRRIMETVSTFDLRGKNVRWVYCHLYQSYALPDMPWVLDETVYYFGKQKPGKSRPLKRTGTIVPSTDLDGPGVHWLKPPP